MLSKSQQRLLLALQKRKEREERGMFIIEGEKFVRDAGRLVEFTFTDRDTTIYREIISTEAPQGTAAVARVPDWTMADLATKPTIVVLDGVQDPGNVGAVLRACLGFEASLLLVETAEITNPKTVRSSASAILRVPWKTVSREEAPALLASFNRPVFRLEHKPTAVTPDKISLKNRILIAGNEGRGLKLPVNGTSVVVPHDQALESLNVGMAVGIVLYELCRISKS